ncbi:hypothetical protein BKA63DRAFT_569340 [Paraphoma chrysanthemicola]|nr:hypothetical protein BKA63DRAFT_569340 [Paraphoma chrysanthemicola]
MAYIHRIEVVRPTSQTILVTDSHEDLPADQNWKGTGKAEPGGSVLYLRGTSGASEEPFAFLRQDDRWTLEVEIHNIGPEYLGHTWLLRVEDQNTRAWRGDGDKQLNSWSKEVKESKAIFSLPFNAAIPHGLWGEYVFHLTLYGSTEGIPDPPKSRIDLETIPLEVYYLPAPKLPKFFDNGVPLLFLRMFLLPQRHERKGFTEASWVSSVTKICFGSNKPFDGSRSFTNDHWLVYNTGDGSPSFASQYGQAGINLDAWLDAYRNWKQHGVVTRVNCYDQAAVTELALCLGISHERVHWEFHQVYGFIDSDIVGWEEVNSPYFDNVETFQKYKDKKDPARQPFRNHAYLSWSTAPLTAKQYEAYNTQVGGVKTREEYLRAANIFNEEHNLNMLMIDSCGGPHVGTETRDEYEAKIEHLDPRDTFSSYVKKDYARKPDRWAEEHHLGAGVSAAPWFHHLPSYKTETYNKAIDDLTRITALGNLEYLRVVLDIEKLLQVFQTYANRGMEGNWTKSKQYTIRPYTSTDGTTVYETKTSFARGKDMRMDHCVAMRVLVNNSPLAVQKAMVEHLAFKALSIESPNTDILERGHVHNVSPYGVTRPVVGSYYTRAFWWWNVAIEVTIEEKAEWVKHENFVLQTVLEALVKMSVQDSNKR